MDTNAVRPPQGGQPSMDPGDWRTQLLPESRQRIVAKITTMLKRHLPSGEGSQLLSDEGSREIERIAARFEEKIYAVASSQSDYLRKISVKMLAMGTNSQAKQPPSNLKQHRVFA